MNDCCDYGEHYDPSSTHTQPHQTPQNTFGRSKKRDNPCNRDTLLSELLNNEPAVTGEKGLARLMAAEEQLNEQRKPRNANYQPSRHIMIMAVLLIEAVIISE